MLSFSRCSLEVVVVAIGGPAGQGPTFEHVIFTFPCLCRKKWRVFHAVAS